MELVYHLAVVVKHSKGDFAALIKALVKNPRTLKVSCIGLNLVLNFLIITLLFKVHFCYCKLSISGNNVNLCYGTTQRNLKFFTF